MTDNRTTERVDHPPRVRKAIDELMRKKDVTSNRTAELREKLTERGVIEWCNDECDNCPYEFDPYGCEQVLTLLEWLESEVRDD